MQATIRAFADAGLRHWIEDHMDFEFLDAAGSTDRLSWSADWDSRTVTFTLLPVDFEQWGVLPGLTWVAPLDAAFTVDGDGDGVTFANVLSTFQQAFPDRSTRAPYMYPGLPDPLRRADRS